MKERLDSITHMNFNLQRKLNMSKRKADQFDSIAARCIQLENTNEELARFVSTSKAKQSENGTFASADMADHFNIQSPSRDQLLVEEDDMPLIARARQSLQDNLIKDDADESNAHLSNDDDEVNGE